MPPTSRRARSRRARASTDRCFAGGWGTHAGGTPSPCPVRRISIRPRPATHRRYDAAVPVPVAEHIVDVSRLSPGPPLYSA